MKKLIRKMALIASVALGLPSVASAAFDAILPFPGDGSGAAFCSAPDAFGTSRDAICIDGTNPTGGAGVILAFKYEGFWSYSIQILAEVQNNSAFLPSSTFGSYDGSTGVGGLDLVLYTQAVGVSNQNVGTSGSFDFEDPTLNSAGGPTTQFDGFWGQNDADGDGVADDTAGTIENGSPVTLGNLLAFLQEANPDNDIPTFLLDLNQVGSDASLLSVFEFLVIDPGANPIDPSDDTILARFALDGTDNGVLDDVLTTDGDETCTAGGVTNVDCDWTLAFGDISFMGASGTVYSAKHNQGSGKADFATFNPDIQLASLIAMYAAECGADCLGVVRLTLGNLNDGAEEVFLTGRIGVPTREVPEPASVALFAIGLLGLGLLSGVNNRQRRKYYSPGA